MNRRTTTPSRAELDDARDRDRAAGSDAALVAYQARWERRISRMQRAHPERWRVPGLSEEEVLDALTLRLIEAVRTPEAHREHEGAGKEWGLCVVVEHLATLRRTFRLGATPTDFRAPPSLLQRDPTPEERWLEQEADDCRARARASAESTLSRPQRRWLSAMRLAANAGEFFEASDHLNLSAASRLLGKNRSSAQRAYRELQTHFARERERLE